MGHSGRAPAVPPALSTNSASVAGTSSAASDCAVRVQVEYPSSLKLLLATEGGLCRARDILHKMEALSVMASQVSLTPGERLIADSQYQAHVSSLDQLAGSTSFHGLPILDGSEGLCLEGRPPASRLVLHAIPDATVDGLGLANASLVSVSEATATLVRVSSAIRAIAAHRAQVLKEVRQLLL